MQKYQITDTYDSWQQASISTRLQHKFVFIQFIYLYWLNWKFNTENGYSFVQISTNMYNIYSIRNDQLNSTYL